MTQYKDLTAKEKAVFNRIEQELLLLNTKEEKHKTLNLLLQNHKYPNYQEAYNILMELWESYTPEEQKEIDKRLKKVGL